MPQQISEWLDLHVYIPLRHWLEQHGKKAGVVVFLCVALAGGWLYYQRYQYQFTETETVLQTQGGHLWATEFHNSYRAPVPFSMDTQPELKWQAQIPGGPRAATVVFVDGTVVIAGREKVLMAFTPQGDILWQVPSTAKPVGTPALDAQGRIFISDVEGHVTAFDSQGVQLWRVGEPSATREAGPRFHRGFRWHDLRYLARCRLSHFAGVLIWRKTAADVFVDLPPTLSADGSLVYLKDVVLDAATGRYSGNSDTPRGANTFHGAGLTGVDGRDYYRNGHAVMHWQKNKSGVQVDPALHLGSCLLCVVQSVVSGCAAKQIDMAITSEYSDGRIVWLDEQSRLVGNFEFPLTNSRIMAMGEKGEAYLCAPTGSRIQCVMAVPGVDKPVWDVFIDDGSRPIGGALVPGALYVSAFDALSAEGVLYALSENIGAVQP